MDFHDDNKKKNGKWSEQENENVVFGDSKWLSKATKRENEKNGESLKYIYKLARNLLFIFTSIHSENV